MVGNGFLSNFDDDSASRDSSLGQDDDDGSFTDSQERTLPSELTATVYDRYNHYLFNDYPMLVEAPTENLTLDDSLPLTDQLKRAIRRPSLECYEASYWPYTHLYDPQVILPANFIREDDFTRIKKELDMDHIGKSSSWDEEKSSAWYSDTSAKGAQSPNGDSFSDEPCPQTKAFSADGKLHNVRVLPSGEVVPEDGTSSFSLPDPYLDDFPKKRKPVKKVKPKKEPIDSYTDSIENIPKKIDINSKYEVSVNDCEKCGTSLKTSAKLKEHLDRHRQLEGLRKHAGQLPSKEQLVKEVPVLVNRALKAIMDEFTLSPLEKRVEAYARRLYYNSFPLWKEISRELVHEVWHYVTLTELTLLPGVDWEHFVWSRNMWLTSGGRRESFVLNLLFLYPDDSEVVEVFFYKFFMKLNESVYKFAMRCLGSPDIISDSCRDEIDIRSNSDLQELHTLCSLVLRTFVKRASQNKTVKGWSAIYKCLKRNFVEKEDTEKPPKSAEMQQWALENSVNLVPTKRAFRFFSLVEAVIENINKVNPTCDGPVALHKMVLRAVYLRQDIIRAWDKLVASSHFEEMDSLYVLEMLVKSFAFFSGCASARKQKRKFSELH